MMNYFNTRMDSSAIIPESLLYCDQSPIRDVKTSMNKADSGLTYYNVPALRKRARDSMGDLFSYPQKRKLSGESLFVEQDMAPQIHNPQSDIDCFVSQHAEKVRFVLEHQRNLQARMVVSAFEEQMKKKLTDKDMEIMRMTKYNWVLQERVKSLSIENQLWKDLAQSNEATANSLRSNLEQVLLANVSEEHHNPNNEAVAVDMAKEAESCCGSSDFGREREHINDDDDNNDMGQFVKRNDGVAEAGDGGCDDVAYGGGGRMMCRKCGVRESRVLVLPCRHLCLCTMCGSTLRSCPVCTSVMNGSVHVNFS
ncbi:E3 ubiquitin-protein ligase BOI-like [Humulus lupulus]|uniref:E3 ubiquitin-protein ligase BOI-like n=1 Tax=Humulus lupulus TaxID=3486 RepID=UPI002B4134FE|nr:E3 ubiquitin-protein ligase BOI-like [Humulus lupulus]XP_062094725.1 E3 ubiquitin-protein ligase BOI-like [Humulus lupulus]